MFRTASAIGGESTINAVNLSPKNVLANHLIVSNRTAALRTLRPAPD